MYCRKLILGATGPRMYYMGSQMYHMRCKGALNVFHGVPNVICGMQRAPNVLHGVSNVLYAVQRGSDGIIWGPKCIICCATGLRRYYTGSQM